MHAEGQAVVAFHIDAGIDAHVLVQVNPVALVNEAELAEGNDWLLGGESQQYAVTLTIAFGQGLGIDAQQQAGIAIAVGKAGGQFGIFVAYFACQCAAESSLRVLGTVDDTSLQLHVCGVLADGKEYCVEQQGVGAQAMNGCTPVDSPLGSESEAEAEFIERNVLRGQKVAGWVLLFSSELHAGRGQQSAQGGMVEPPVLQLLGQFLHELVGAVEQFLQGAACSELEVKVACTQL